MTTRKRRGAGLPAVPARWEAPGKIETLPPATEAPIGIPSIADALAREQIAEAEAGAAITPTAISEVQADAEADLIADRGIFHPGGHRTARRGGR